MFAAAGVLAVVASGLWIAHLEIRPPCYPGYVRFLDLPMILPEIAGGLGLVSAALYVIERVRPPRRRGVMRVLTGCILVLLTLFLVVSGADAVASDHSRYDDSCWTF